MSDEHLYYSDLDRELTVWGNARDGQVTATGFGYDGQDIAGSRWDPSDRSTGDIAYYHPDSGWTNAATGRAVELERDGLERT
jgi:hypothetical protein